MAATLDVPRIVTSPDVMSGKPVIRGTRITVEIVLRRIADGYSIADLQEDWPHVTADDIKAAIAFAADQLPRSAPVEAA